MRIETIDELDLLTAKTPFYITDPKLRVICIHLINIATVLGKKMQRNRRK